MFRYYLYRFNLTARSWLFWIRTPFKELQERANPYSVGDLYWSHRDMGETIAANFWYMLNDGHYDMLDEFLDV
jgi:hypothetical protein